MLIIFGDKNYVTFTHFLSIFPFDAFDASWKQQKTKGFTKFLGWQKGNSGKNFLSTQRRN